MALDPRVNQMAQKHNLTAAQAAVLNLLVQGWSLQAIAAQRDIATNTVRAHLMATMHKTNTTTERELVAKVMEQGPNDDGPMS